MLGKGPTPELPQMKDPVKKARGDGKRAEGDRELDEALEESFPASDPSPTTGTSAGAPDERDSGRMRRKPRDPKAAR